MKNGYPAMSRRRLEIGEVGSVNAQKVDGGYRARCWYRGQDGRKRQVDITRRNKKAATNDARAIASERANLGNSEINLNSELTALMAAWWETIEARNQAGELSDGTLQNYRRTFDRIDAGIGHLLIRECRTLRLQGWIKDTANGFPSVHRDLRLVLFQVFQRGLELEVVDVNPVAGVVKAGKKKNETKALTPEEAVKLRHLVHRWEHENVGKPNVNKDGKRVGGTRNTAYIADVVDVMLGTGLRISEVLGLRWEDIDLAAETPTLTVNGALKVRKANGKHGSLIWEPRTKTNAGYRVIELSPTLVDLLTRQFIDNRSGVIWVFPSIEGTPRFPANVRTRLRKVCGTTFEGLTPHTLRRTFATIVEEEAGLRTASMALGHSSLEITEKAYVRRGHLAKGTSTIIESAIGDEKLQTMGEFVGD